jgi:hypothetical protein
VTTKLSPEDLVTFIDALAGMNGRRGALAARWLLRYLDDSDGATIDEAAMEAACLAAPPKAAV